MNITTVGDLRDFIKDLPGEMEVRAHNEGEPFDTIGVVVADEVKYFDLGTEDTKPGVDVLIIDLDD